MAGSLLDECEATPIEILEFMIGKWGKEWSCWTPETLWTTIEIDETSPLCLYNKNKLQAIQTILSNDVFWKDWMAFEKICLSLNNIPPRFDEIEEVTPAQMAYAVRVAEEIRRYPSCNTPGPNPVFNDEVKSYAAARCYYDGLVFVPAPLEFVQKHLDKLTKQRRLADRIKATFANPDSKIEETPEGVGAVRAAAIKAYAFSNKRKPIL